MGKGRATPWPHWHRPPLGTTRPPPAPPPPAPVGMERRSSRTGRGRRYLEFIEDIHSTKKKPKAAEPEQEDKTVTEQEDKTVTEEGEGTAKKKRRRSGCGTCEGCSAEDCQEDKTV